jgi:hypothetical protein
VRKFVIVAAVTVTLGFAGAIGWQANAAAPVGNIPHAGPYTPIHPADCRGTTGAHGCGPGSHWVCGPEGRRCWCTPC